MMAEVDIIAEGAEHDVPDGAEHPDAHDAGHRGGQGQRLLQGVPQGEDGQRLPGHRHLSSVISHPSPSPSAQSIRYL